MTPDLLIIIINYNTAAFTIGCLDSIKSSPPSTPHQIVVIDNNSTDADAIAAAHPEITLVRSERNLGFAGANNLIAQRYPARYVLLLNNDTIVLPGAIDRAVREMAADDSIGAVGITLLNADRSLQATYMPFPSLRREFLIFTTLGRRLYGPLYPSQQRGSAPREVDWMSGAFLLLRRDAYARVGWMDEAYFMYGEECDLQYRMRQAGWRMVYVPEAEIVHFWGKSSRPYQRRQWIHQGTLRFYALHYGRLRNVALRAMLALISSVKLLVWLLLCSLPRWRERGRRELASNKAIAALYLQARLPAAHSQAT